MRAKRGEAIRFYNEVVLLWESDECLLWPFALSKAGYPQAKIDGKTTNIHRRVCIIKKGQPPTDEHEAAHNCNAPACCNGRHLRWALPIENIHDKFANGTMLRGSEHGAAKITEEQVIEIRALKGKMPQWKVGEMYSIDQSNVSRIMNEKDQWGWLKQTA